jgi:hypothetical protein
MDQRDGKYFNFMSLVSKLSNIKKNLRKPQFLDMIGPNTNRIQEMENFLISSL